MSRSAGFSFAGKFAIAAALLAACIAARGAQDQAKPGEPTDPKARKTFAEAIDWQNHGDRAAALDDFRKANRQDSGHCAQCLSRAYFLAQQLDDFKAQEGILRDWLQLDQSDAAKATLHFELGVALQREGIGEKGEKRDTCLNQSCEEFKTTLQLDPKSATAHYGMGVSLANLHQDDAARAAFQRFLDQDTKMSNLHVRAERFLDRIDLARARMAPPFELTTLDGQHISMDSLAGNVVLIDFWATWCGPCREALPHIREIARKFQGQPFVVLSVSLDTDEAKWKDFVAKNDMTWLQYRDGRFKGPIATRFRVDAIPATFSIDADGVLEDEHVGDADIEGKLKKMIAHAVEVRNSKPAPAVANPGSGGGS
jgi:thiol-disulfide isomerase/thioredoxin